MRPIHALLGLAALSAPAAAQSVWFADNLCPLADFTSAQAAIDAAADGDTIVVRNGAGDQAIVIDGKALTLVGQQVFFGTDRATLGDGTGGVLVRNTAPGQTVSIRGFEIEPRLQVLDCDGAVWIENSLAGPGDTPQPAPTVLVRDSDEVVMVRCDVTATKVGNRGRDAAEVDSGRLLAYGSTFTGGSATLSPAPGQDGGDGIRVLTDGYVLLDDCFTRGGVGGNTPAGGCGVGGEGGAGLRLTHVGSTAWEQSTIFVGGAGGNLANNCPNGQAGESLAGNGVGNLVDLGDASRGVATPGVVLAGAPFDLELQTEPGDLTFMLLGIDAAPVTLSAYNGAILPALGTSLVLDFGALSGTLPVTLPADLAPVGMPVSLVFQPLTLDAQGAKRSGAGSWLTVLDPGQGETFSCASTFWVDDDAPNDPGPNNGSVSDPLEDGSEDHPFDTVQKALAAAFNGSTIILRDGGYAGSVAIQTSDVTLRSENGAATCLFQGTLNLVAPRILVEGITVDGSSRGIWINGDDARVRDCVVTSSSEGIEVTGVGATIDGCTLTGNTLGLDVRSPVVVVRDTDIVSNTQGVHMGLAGELFLVDCDINDNTTRAMTLAPFSGDVLLFMDRCNVLRNGFPNATNGAIQASSAHVSMQLRNSVFADNVNNKTAALISPGPLDIDHCTFANNGKPFPTIQSSATPDLDVTLSNSIFWGPNVPISSSGNLTLEYCLVENGLLGVFSFLPPTVVGPLLSGPPSFVNTATGNYHLSPTSPCIDAGDPAFVADPGDKDVDGQPRVAGAATDIGADERQN